MRSMHSAITWALATALATVSSQTQAKPPQPYHVEMIIFERGAASSQLEYWPDDIKLSYPTDVAFIKSQTQAQNSNTDQAISSTSDSSASPLEEPSTQNNQSDFLDPRILPARNENQEILKSEAAKLARRYRVLFHKAWQQTFTATNKAPSVIINGGDLFDGRSELGGSIRLSINKFIHLDTDLWLAKFSPNLGQAQQWPMPPLAPEPREAKSEDNTFQVNQYETPTIGITAQALNTVDKYRFDGNTTLSDPYALGNKERFNFLPQTVYSLKQSRRMRSRELHYIDHPRFAIVVRIDPISFEEVISQQ